jgi:chromosomal replication initiator protein
MPTTELFWSTCLSTFERELSAQQFNTWIKPLRLEGDDEGLQVLAPNRFAIQFVKDRFLTRIEDLAKEYFGKSTLITLALGSAQEAKPASSSSNDTIAKPAAAGSKPSPMKQMGASHETTRLIPTYTFDNLVTGKANQLARAAAMQIAENPGVAYNPLFVYGGSGLGKTHLVHAIGNLCASAKPAGQDSLYPRRTLRIGRGACLSAQGV